MIKSSALFKTLILICTIASISVAAADDKTAPSDDLLQAFTYLTGNDHITRNPEMARFILEQAHAKNANDHDINSLLSSLYQMGIGGPQDWSKSLEVLIPSAQQDDFVAQTSLAFAYVQGIAIPQDFKKAYEWAVKSYNNAPDDVSNNQILGYMYMLGLGVTQDYSKAFFHYEKSAKAGSRFAQSKLSNLYSLGLGTEQDFKKAYEWAHKAAQQGDANAIESLFTMNSTGQGTTIDHDKAFQNTIKMAIQGDASAQAALSIAYWFGIGTRPNLEAAIYWREESCKNGLIMSCTQ